MTATATNYWADARCAKAFWSQHELPPYQELLRDTADWLEPGIGQRWLDLGCGSGQLARVLWEKSQGKVEAIVGVDLADVNEEAFVKLCAQRAADADADVFAVHPPRFLAWLFRLAERAI